MKKNGWATIVMAAFILSGTATTYATPIQEPLAAQLVSAAKREPVYICPMGHATQSHKPGFCRECGMQLADMTAKLRVAVLVFDDVEDIDFAGPMEVFTQSGATQFTVGASLHPVRTVAGLKLQPDYDFENAPKADVVLIPGGDVSAVADNPKLLAWVRQRSVDARVLLSVCTGAFILGKAGLLDGIEATTIAGMHDQLASMFPKTRVVRDQRYVDNGIIITTGGLSAGIDGALHVVDREFGRLTAKQIARGLEYRWTPGNRSEFGSLAGLRIPPVTSIFPIEASWQEHQDDGDTQHWTLAGHLEIAMTAEAFLAGSAKRILKEGWVLDQSRALQSSFTKQEAGGQIWLLKIKLAADTAPSTYFVTVSIEKQPATPEAG